MYSFTLCSFESPWLEVRRYGCELCNGQNNCAALIIDPHLKPHENYSNELSDLNVNLTRAGETTHLITPLGVYSTVHDVQLVCTHVHSTMSGTWTLIGNGFFSPKALAVYCKSVG